MIKLKHIYKYNSAVVLVAMLLFTACKTSKKAVSTEPKKETSNSRVDFKTAKTLLKLLRENEFKFQSLSAKLDVTALVEDKDNSLGVTLRIRKDSAIWMSISPALGIEAARVLITRDSVKFMDRINSKYFVGDFNYLSQMLQTDLDYQMIESLLIGNSAEFYEEDEKLKAAKDSSKYLLSTIRKRKIRKALNQEQPKQELIQRIYLDPNTFKVSSIIINDFVSNREFKSDYSAFQDVDSLKFPHTINIGIKATKNIKIKIDYSKLTTNKTLTYPFSIPNKYEPIIQK